MIGTTIAHYRITEKIGEGGMGEVYRATDTKLIRDVALKILPEQFAADSQRMTRFQREAEILASLDHSNIGAIYGIEDVGKTKALVLQLIEGPTLADRIAHGPIPMEEALPIALQIAEALEAAHEKGVIHRDLKPANIKITPEGQVKVLDFGLAKAMEDDPKPSPDMSESPTLSLAATQVGVILGTAAYMSPEQVRGAPVDRQTDVWAFGCVLFEMLAGEKAFSGSDFTAVVRADPQWDLLTGVTVRLSRLLARCLAKEPRQRWHHIADVRLELAQIRADGTNENVPSSPADARMPRRAYVWTATALVAGAALTAFLGFYPTSNSQPTRLLKFDFAWQGHLRPWDGPAVSSDGTMVVYRNSGMLWIRDLDDTRPRKLEGTEGGGQPFWSPDGNSIGYFTNRHLHKVPTTGGPSTTLCRLPADFWGGAFWTDNGRILIGQGPKGIFEVAEHGEVPRLVLEPAAEYGDKWLYWPRLLPDGHSLMFVSLKEDGTSEIAVVSSGDRISVVQHPEFLSWPSFAATGHIVYERGASTPRGVASVSIWALPFDGNELTRIGEPFQIVPEGTSPTVSSTGMLTYRSRPTTQNSLVWVNRDGVVRQTIGRPQDLIRNPSIAPDGSRVAVEGVDTSGFDIWIHDDSRGTKQRLTSDLSENRQPVWAPDGHRIAFGSAGSVFLCDVSSGAQPEKLISVDAVEEIYLDWSQDGEHLIFHYMPRDQSHRDIWQVSLFDNAQPMPLVRSPGDQTLPQISPDGRHVLYQSSEAGNYLPDVFLVEFPGGGNKRQVSIAGGTHARWSPDGDELFYVDPANNLVAVSFDAETATLGRAVPLFRSADVDTDLSRNLLSFLYDVGPGADRFVVVQSPGGGRVMVVENWIREFAERQ